MKVTITGTGMEPYEFEVPDGEPALPAEVHLLTANEEIFLLQSLNAELSLKVKGLERENKILTLKSNASLANNLCPDHRDKQYGKPCLACTIERLEKRLKDAEECLKSAYDRLTDQTVYSNEEIITITRKILCSHFERNGR